MKIYEFYIQKEKLPQTVVVPFCMHKRRMLSDDYIFYGYTKKKDLALSFKQERIDDFIMRKIHLSKKEYEYYHHEFQTYEISYIPYDNFKDFINILSTMNEYRYTESEWRYLLDPEKLLSHISENLFYSLKEEYKKALKTLGFSHMMEESISEDYSILMDLNCSDEGIIHRSFAHNSRSIPVDFRGKEVNLFLYIFGKLLKDK